MSKISKKLIELCEKEYGNKPLIVPLGEIDKDERVYIDFTEVSGLFIAGATGSGKSVMIDTIIHALMYKNKPQKIKFYLIDPKGIELNEYDGLDYVVGGKSESDVYKITKYLFDINNIVDSRVKKLVSNKVKSLSEYNKKNTKKLEHIFVVIDEGTDIYNSDAKKYLEKILDFGDNVGVHLIYSTNAYLKEYYQDEFLDKFKYRMSFDLASKEQAEYLDIKNSNLLSKNGEAYIKGIDSVVYKFQALYVPNKEISAIILKNKNK